MTWIGALKKWNMGGCCWSVPRKGTDCYQEVLGLMPEKKLKHKGPKEKAAMPISVKEIMKQRARKRKTEPGQQLMAEIRALVDEAKAKAREGESAKELTAFYNKKISPKIDLYGAEYLGYGGGREIANELFEEISAEYRKHPFSL